MAAQAICTKELFLSLSLFVVGRFVTWKGNTTKQHMPVLNMQNVMEQTKCGKGVFLGWFGTSVYFLIEKKKKVSDFDWQKSLTSRLTKKVINVSLFVYIV